MPDTELEVMEEMLKWLEFMGRREAIGVVRDAVSFDDDERTQAAKIVYQLSNGERTLSEIDEHVPFGTSWISDRQREWATEGILRKDGPKSQYEHILSLDELGIDYPEVEGVEA